MKINFYHNHTLYSCSLDDPHDLSIAVAAGPGHVSAWYVEPVSIEPVRNSNWIGSVREGGTVNFNNIKFNPHGHGTHTECVGHISAEFHSVNTILQYHFFIAQLISVTPKRLNDDAVITIDSIRNLISGNPEALVLRTLPNTPEKLTRNWSDTNPPYLEKGLGIFLRDSGVKHLLLDLPSVDREKDEGRLTVHHEFWNYPDQPRLDATITELIFVPDELADDIYLLNLQVAAFENDASPSRPVLFRITKE